MIQSNASPVGQWLPLAKEVMPWIVEMRQRIHQHPELMYEEFDTRRLRAARRFM
ncbi:MAG: hypothetical protein P8J33_14050 [Pirellulaceae bacterium]|nr:hypothetical protein [Pirellulaceae bacterium]